MPPRPLRFLLLGCCTFQIVFSITFVDGLSAAAPQQADRRSLKTNFRQSHASERLTLQSKAAAVLGVAANDTLDVLAIRVDFKPDTIAQTTGNGRFLLSPQATYTIDAPPHDRAYFDAQLLALKNYYANVSRGKLFLRYQVFPAGNADVYHLEQPMNYYAPGRRAANSDQRLAELFRDGFQKADAAGGIDFSKFDSFILFHAGVGEDFAEEADRTPNDVPSAFLTLEDLRQELASGDPNYQGIAVQNGSFFIPDGSILPETQTREIVGSGLVEFGLLGTAALMFGHQLGLPNLFNTDNGTSGVGYFGLMDQGSNNFIGLLPAQPEAWSKVFLGWETPIVVNQGENLDVAATLHANPNKVYKIPITDSEYFLIENRQRDVNGDRVAIGRDVNGNRIEFHDYPRQEIIAGGPLGVITQVDEYDFGLPFAIDASNRLQPGCGILIWHIDDEVIRKNYASNRVNADINRRGVDLEEADGAQDLGRFYGFIDPGAGTENGVPEDAWWKSNPVIIEFLRPDQPVEFGPNTMPSTASNTGAQTGIVVTNFSEVLPVMTFSVRNDFAAPNFPQYVSAKPNALPPMLADLTGDTKLDIVAATTASEILAWQADGRKVIDNLDVATIVQPNGLPVSVPKATFAVLSDSLFSPPVLVDLNGDRRAEVLAAGKDGRLRAWQASDANLDGRADLLWQFDLGAPCRANIAVRIDSGFIICGVENGKLFGVSFSGARRWEAATNLSIRGISLLGQNSIVVTSSNQGLAIFDNAGRQITGANLSPAIAAIENFSDAAAVADLNNDGRLEIIVRDGAGGLHVSAFGGAESNGFSVRLSAPKRAGVAVGDINNDGRKEIVLLAGNRLHAYNFNGTLTENFPLQISTVVAANTSYPISPIIADADGDGVQDVLISGVDGNVYAYHANGTLVSGFPLAMSGAGLGSLAAADVEGDGKLELVGVSGNGFVHVWYMPASGAAADWPFYHYDVAQTSLNTSRETPVVVPGKLMPTNLVYNYPNPTEGNSTTIRYRLNSDAQVKVSIYDSAGDLVTELSGPGLAQADNEVVWNLNGVQSGIYLGRVEAKGESESSVAIIKIAVVK